MNDTRGSGRFRAILATLTLVPLWGCGAEDARPAPTGAGLAVVVAPMTLPGVTDVAYTLTAKAGGQTVWTRAVTSSAYGDGAGSLSYVGPCDADAGLHTVELVITSVTAGSAPLVAGTDYYNPAPVSAPVTQTALCTRDTDTPVRFDLTLARRATQGFFDVAVEFEDIFCSAKLDCLKSTPSGDAPLELLFHPFTGERDLTAVLALSCTTGPDDAATILYMDDVNIACADGAYFSVNPALGPGNLDPYFPGPPNTYDLLFQTATYRGLQATTGYQQAYWNVALGLNEAAFTHLGPCVLTGAATATASSTTVEGGWTRPGAAWAYVAWTVDLIDADGALACTRHAVGDGHGVDVVYTSTAGERFAATYDPTTGTVLRHEDPVFPSGLEVPNVPPSAFAHTIDGLFTGFPTAAPDFEWSDVTPVVGPSTHHFYFDYQGGQLAGMLEGITCPAALDPSQGIHLAVSTDGGAYAWQLYITVGDGLVSAVRNGVDVTALALAQGAIALATSPNGPTTLQHLVEFSLPAGAGGFSYRVVGADQACQIPGGDTVVYGHCAPGGGIAPPVAGAPRAGQPVSGVVAAGDYLAIPGAYTEPPALTLDGVPIDLTSMSPDTVVIQIPPGTAPGPHTVVVCLERGACTTTVITVGAAQGPVRQPAVPVSVVDGAFTGASAGGVYFEWGPAAPAQGTHHRICGCGTYYDMPCLIVDWQGGTFADADRVVVYGGSPDGGRLAIVGLADGSVAAWLDGRPVDGLVGRVAQSYSPWSGGTSIVLEACLPLPWTTYTLGVSGPCPGTGLCDDGIALDMTVYEGGAYTVQTPTRDPRVVMLGPGPGSDPLTAAKATFSLGQPGGSFVVRGANLGATAGEADFHGPAAPVASGDLTAWTPSIAAGPIPLDAVTGDFFLRTLAGIATNVVRARVGDTDQDGTPDADDNCPDLANADQADADADDVGDACDNCPAASNLAQTETDEDGHGDACDAFPADLSEWRDSDGDGVGDNSDCRPNDNSASTPDCAGKICGADGCGGVCGSCASGYVCASGGTACTSEPCQPSLAFPTTAAPDPTCTNIGPLATAYTSIRAITCANTHNFGGYAPRAFYITWPEPMRIDGVILRPDMLPNGTVRHYVQVKQLGESTWTTVYDYYGGMASSQWYRLKFAAPVTTRELRVYTASSPSWVSWYMIAPMQCRD